MAAEAAVHEKMELRQLAAHALARVGAAMARPEEAEVQAALAELRAEDGAAEAHAPALTLTLDPAISLNSPLTLAFIVALTRRTARPRIGCESRLRRHQG